MQTATEFVNAYLSADAAAMQSLVPVEARLVGAILERLGRRNAKTTRLVPVSAGWSAASVDQGRASFVLRLDEKGRTTMDLPASLPEADRRHAWKRRTGPSISWRAAGSTSRWFSRRGAGGSVA